jgi:DNA modification methylase
MTNVVCSKLAVEYQPIDRLAPFPTNARTHSKPQIRQIAASIKQFGFTNPILVDSQNIIIAGHGRVAAAKLLGMEHIATIRLEGLTKDQIRAYVVADNRLAEKAGWDKSILAIELQHLLTLDLDFDATITGFEIADIDLVIHESRKEQDKDDVVEFVATGQPVTQPGNTWQLGKHRIFCGSALDATSFKSLMAGRRAHLAFIDPPYNTKIDGNVSGHGSIRHREFAMASGEMSEVEFVSFLVTSLGLLARHSTNGAIHFICMDWRHSSELLAAGKQTYAAFMNICVWAKNNGGIGSFYRSRHELIFVFKSGKAPHRNNIMLGRFGRDRSNIWAYPCASTFSKQGDEGNLLKLHPTVKPVALIADALLDCSAPGDIVLDSFLGSGSTLIAAQRVGRVCYGMEIEPRYVDVAIQRWQRHTGGNAIHESSGKRFDDLRAAAEGGHGRS